MKKSLHLKQRETVYPKVNLKDLKGTSSRQIQLSLYCTTNTYTGTNSKETSLDDLTNRHPLSCLYASELYTLVFRFLIYLLCPAIGSHAGTLILREHSQLFIFTGDFLSKSIFNLSLSLLSKGILKKKKIKSPKFHIYFLMFDGRPHSSCSGAPGLRSCRPLIIFDITPTLPNDSPC